MTTSRAHDRDPSRPQEPGRVLTPMEQKYPAICQWTRHQGVNTDALRQELKRALAWLDEESGYCENQACCSERGHEGKCDERAAL